jgi:hypothetical protein
VRILLRLKLFFVDSHKFLPTARVLPKTVVSDPVKPCGKARFTPKAANIFIGAKECLLGEIVCESNIRSGKLTEQTAHGRLMPTNQLAESVLVVIDKNSCDKVRIS